MSGGVDSSVSAALLKRAGFEVIGVFIRVWEPSGFVCRWREERREARRAAAHLDIPLSTLDLSREYKKRVVDYFIAEYKSGRTPNPDVMCNKHIKFGVFYDWAMKNGADFVATGHYAQICNKFVPKFQTINSKLETSIKFQSLKFKKLNIVSDLEINISNLPSFCQSKDLAKDQTYFLWNLKAEQLAKILFPVGQYTKPQVRALAKKFGLPNAEKKDSQGLCFIGKIDFKDFLKREIYGKRGTCPERSRGGVLNEQGKVIGQHDGAMFFTLGERHGFEIFSQTSDSKPYYIVAKDIKKNTLTVSPNFNQGQALTSEVKIEKTNWINQSSDLEVKPLGASRFNLQARVRYRQPLQACHLTQVDNKKSTATISFSKPQLAVSGQSLVLYNQNICLGGGIIV